MKKVFVFGSKHCKPCEGWKRMLKEAGVKYEYIDVEENPKMANEYLVNSLPTTIVLDSDKVKFFYAGAGKKGLKELKGILK